jgi:hypothetical protein
MTPTVILALLFLAAQIPVLRKHGVRGVFKSWFARSFRSWVWGIGTVFAAMIEVAFVSGAFLSHGNLTAVACSLAGAFLLGGWLLSGVWLLAIARRGTVSPRTLYLLGQLLFVFSRTDETVSGALLLAAMTLARRGPATDAERAWLWTKLKKQERGLGTFAVATAVTFLLEARAARDDRQLTAAHEATLLARALLGTVSYASDKGAPGVVRKLAGDLHALVSAELGDWGFVGIAEDQWLTDEVRALRAAVIEHIGDPRQGQAEIEPPVASAFAHLVQMTTRALSRKRKPAPPSLLGDTFARRFADAKAAPTEVPFETAQRDARAIHAALSRGEIVGGNEQFLLLAVFDVLLSPEAPHTVIPEAMREDEGAVAAMQDDVADGIARLLVNVPPPLGAIKTYGPISARVHGKLESVLQTELHTCCERINRRLKDRWRGTAYEEWMEATKVRLAYRRLEQALGTPAARQAWALYASSAVRLGVAFSETFPRRRPLSYCIFHSLYKDAHRFGDVANMRQQGHNMRVTA